MNKLSSIVKPTKKSSTSMTKKEPSLKTIKKSKLTNIGKLLLKIQKKRKRRMKMNKSQLLIKKIKKS